MEEINRPFPQQPLWVELFGLAQVFPMAQWPDSATLNDIFINFTHSIVPTANLLSIKPPCKCLLDKEQYQSEQTSSHPVLDGI